MKALPSLLLLAGLALPRVAAATCDVTDFGATGDGTTDDRLAIQAAIDACHAGGDPDVFVPDGVYSVSRAGGAYYNLNVPGGTRLRGESRDGAVLQQAPGMAGSVRLLHVVGNDIVIENLTLDGNKAAQVFEEHRAGIFAYDSKRLLVRDVVSQNFTGDGFTLYNAVQNATFYRVIARDNDRDGIAFTPHVTPIDGVTLLDSTFHRNQNQQVDSEGKQPTDNVKIMNCTIDGTGSNDYAMTVSGSGYETMSRDWSIINNTIHGGIYVVWAQRVSFVGNQGVNPTTKPCYEIWRSSADVTIDGNTCTMTQTSVRSLANVGVFGTSAVNSPTRILVSNNRFTTSHGPSFGVRADGVRSIEVVNNELTGAGVPSDVFYAGVQVRATLADSDVRSVVIRGNTIRRFGSRGVTIAGNGSARIQFLDVSGNRFEDSGTPASMKVGVSLDDGTGAAKLITVTGNQCSGGVTQCVTNVPAASTVIQSP